jgi:hypothetical protein
MKDKKKSSVFSHYILTRFNQGIYDREDADQWMEDRLKLFEKTKESVLSQEGDFKWIIAIDPKTPADVSEKIFTDTRMIPVDCDIRETFDLFLAPKTPYVITSRLDNDDIYLPGAVLAIQAEFQPQVYVIDIDYIQNDIVNEKKYTSGNKLKKEKYRTLNNGPFLSLCEPSDYIRTCYCRPHNRLLDGYPAKGGRFKRIPSTKVGTFAEMVIHDKNMMNKVTGYRI